ncbi:MAG: type III-B CRISPR module-associated protein Cmr5 [Pseudomonadota bacterium]
MSRTLAQERSSFALKEVGKINQAGGDKFAKLTAGLPAMVLQNGFGQALAFLLAKGTKDGRPRPGDRHLLVFDIIAAWLKQQRIIVDAAPSKAMGELSKMNQKDYLRAQDEALAVLEWVKRYAGAGLFHHTGE